MSDNNNNNDKGNEIKRLDAFVAKDPSSEYTIDQKEQELCRQLGGSQQDCIKLNLEYTQMFTQMQELGFFCSLPMDPTLTHMECRRV
ncbi:hypothetical protein DM01DRAFT_1335094 [Hesseltinella vesiculosa]|uniref:Uncharacterized protein n=1 Tax=Hesseltinella vesiculosa TaxID=101127 RepID=A0A1X2GK12_9FUNG|nr:hypothetical protein DM01DRAFT_1335094 [Hesseltinella vesiculosa]